MAARRFEVVLRRANGRFVKLKEANSRYAAKLIQRTWEAKYDDTYYVEILEVIA